MLAWSRSRGVFAGISLQGSTLRTDGEENKELYGKEMSAREVVRGTVAAPAVANAMEQALGLAVDEVPVTPEMVMRIVMEGKKRRAT